jgi:Zn-dependent protease with chaperone function
MITCFALLEQFKDSKAFRVITVVAFIFMMIRKSNVTTKFNINVSDGIYLEGYILESIQEDVTNMCLQLGIKILECKIIATEDINVKSKINENGIPQINITNGFISKIYEKDARDILLITIAHELGHIYYNVFFNISKRIRWSNFLYLVLTILNMMGLIASNISPIFLFITLPIMGVENIFGKVMCDARFWEQIAEIRADRLAINVCKYDKMKFVEFWKEYSKKHNKEETNIIDQFYRRYIKVEGHPSMDRRMELIEKRQSWNWWEYFEHALIILKWRITNKGWNGI